MFQTPSSCPHGVVSPDIMDLHRKTGDDYFGGSRVQRTATTCKSIDQTTPHLPQPRTSRCNAQAEEDNRPEEPDGQKETPREGHPKLS